MGVHLAAVGLDEKFASRALERALASEDVAAVLCEPAMTNIGMVLPQPGFHQKLRDEQRFASLEALKAAILADIAAARAYWLGQPLD